MSTLASVTIYDVYSNLPSAGIPGRMFYVSTGTNAGKVYRDNGSTWDQVATGGGGSSPLTTKGDVFGFDTADARIPVGTDTYVLTADSGAALGVSWQPGGGGGLFPWNPSPSQPPALASWTQINPTSTGTYGDVQAGVTVGVTSSAANLTLLTRAAPGAPFTLTARIQYAAFSGNYLQDVALAVGDGTKYEASGPLWDSGALVVFLSQWNSASSFNSDYAGTPFSTQNDGNNLWWRVKYDGTNLIYSFSGSGTTGTFVTYATHSATHWLSTAPTVIGFGVNNDGPAVTALNNLVYWSVTTP